MYKCTSSKLHLCLHTHFAKYFVPLCGNAKQMILCISVTCGSKDRFLFSKRTQIGCRTDANWTTDCWSLFPRRSDLEFFCERQFSADTADCLRIQVSSVISEILLKFCGSLLYSRMYSKLQLLGGSTLVPCLNFTFVN